MFEIIENVKLEMDNVLSFKGEITQQEMVQIIKEMEQIVSNNGAEKKGNIVTATFDVKKKGNQIVMAVQVLVPLNKKINSPSGYVFKPVFRLNNAIKLRHYGNPSKLQENMNKLVKYIEEKGLMPITPGYNVTINEPSDKNNMEDLIVDIYIGVSDNIL